VQADISSDQLKTLIQATGNEVEAYWPILFAAYLQKVGVEKLLLTVSSGGGGGGGGGGAAAGGAAAAEEEKEEEEEEEVDMGAAVDMFGG
jgi:large subunit ribosomal protein LP1